MTPVRRKLAKREHGNRQRQPHIWNGASTGNGTLPSPSGEERQKNCGFPDRINAFTTMECYLNSANGENAANGAWIHERERTCNA